jgi:DNA repair exonuclease SbcCD ATPase subunit
MPTIGEAVEGLTKLSGKLNALADKLLEEAFARLRRGEISKDDYLEINEKVMKIYAQVTRVNDRMLEKLGEQIEAPLDDLARVTKDLKKARKDLNRAQDIVAICTKALSTAAAVAAAIVAPNPLAIAAAISGAAALVNDIVAAVE